MYLMDLLDTLDRVDTVLTGLVEGCRSALLFPRLISIPAAKPTALNKS